MTKIEEGLKKHIYELEQELESTHKIVAKQSADITVYEEIVDDLESKLAKKEEQLRESREWFIKCDKERLSEETKKNIAFTNYQETLQENKKLKQQLAEKEKEYNQLEILHYKDIEAIESCSKEIYKTKYRNGILESQHQDKISFAVEQIIKLKEKLIKFLQDEGFYDNEWYDFYEIIDNQIEELKKEMK